MTCLRATIYVFFFQAEDGIRDADVTGVQTCALPISKTPITGPDRNHAAGTLPELFERLRYRLAGQYPLPRHVRRNQRFAVDGVAGRQGVSPAPDTAADRLQFRQDWQLRPDRHARGPAEHPGRQPMALGRLAADDHSWPAADFHGPFHGPVVAGHTLC